MLAVTFGCSFVLDFGAAVVKTIQGPSNASEMIGSVSLVGAPIEVLTYIIVRAGVLSVVIGCAHAGVQVRGSTRSVLFTIAAVVAAVGLFLLS